MAWSDEETDELLVRYLDQELSSKELERFEQRLVADASLRQKLSEWKELTEGLRELRTPVESRHALGPDFAERVLHAARMNVRDQGDLQLAPWIPRNEQGPNERGPTVESASRLQARDIEADAIMGGSKGRRAMRRLLVGGAASAIAASLLAMVFWTARPPAMNTLWTNPGLSLSKDDHERHPGIEESIVLRDASDALRDASDKATLPLESPAENLSADRSNRPSAANVTSRESSKETVDLKQLASNPDRRVSALDSGKDATSGMVGAELRPNAEQIKLLEGMLANPNGMFLFVIDVGLPEGVASLDALRSILDRHDIAWASELEIDEATQANLAKSRMIAEAGKQGLLADFVDPNSNPSKPKENEAGKEVVSLVFVKARGARLDAAIIDVMRQTEEFPGFSFDLAFDAPTHALMNELRSIQEANLPSAIPSRNENVSNMIRRPGDAARDAWVTSFVAGPRRTNVMELETRRQSKLPIQAEMMNPIAYALFIVRHAEGDSTR